MLAILTSGSIVIAVKSAKSADMRNAMIHQLQSEAVATTAKLNETTAAQDVDQKTIAFLQGEVSKLCADLSNSTARYERYAASAPKPTYQPDGSWFFAKVAGLSGGTICSNATYHMTFGSRVFFKLSDGNLKGIEVDDLNPLVLQYLGIDSDATKVKQRELNAASAAQRQAYFDQVAMRQQANAVQSVANAKIAIEQQKAADEQAAKYAALETERIKANAAMVEAQKPPVQINNNINQQQQQQVQQRPQPRGYLLNNGVWVPYY